MGFQLAPRSMTLDVLELNDRRPPLYIFIMKIVHEVHKKQKKEKKKVQKVQSASMCSNY